MKITKEEIKKIAELARLKLSKEEIEKYTKQLSAILEYMDKLNKLKLDDLIDKSTLDNFYNVTSEDIVIKKSNKIDLLRNTPDKKDGYIKVKSIL